MPNFVLLLKLPIANIRFSEFLKHLRLYIVYIYIEKSMLTPENKIKVTGGWYTPHQKVV